MITDPPRSDPALLVHCNTVDLEHGVENIKITFEGKYLCLLPCPNNHNPLQLPFPRLCLLGNEKRHQIWNKMAVDKHDHSRLYLI